METTSPTLLNRLKGGNEPEAWRRFVLLYTPLLYSWAGRLNLQEADEDHRRVLAAITFLKAR